MKPLKGELKTILFHKLNVGDEFSTGRSKGAGIFSDRIDEQIYRKTSKSNATPIDGTSGYARFTEEHKGGSFHFAPFRVVCIQA